jgi:hypothetical protein
MKDIEKIKKILAEHKRQVGRRFKAKDIGVFGSYVTGIEKREAMLTYWSNSKSLWACLSFLLWKITCLFYWV